MVRLKDGKAINMVSSSRFQFHYGSVKSIELPEKPKKQEKFQFHYGSVKRGKT